MNHFEENYKTPLVLIIDDVPANLDVLIEHLHQEDMELMVALSGEEGIKLAADSNPDLILLDIMMPGLDGFETCERLKANPVTCDIPVVYLTASDKEADVERGLHLGAVDFISKPFSIPILKARINNHIGLSRKRNLLLKLATTDELTRTANRRHFDYMFELEWSRAIRHHNSLSLISIDIDYFKRYNDYYGHPEGDRCLLQVARVLGSCLVRSSDMLARLGGEEFMVLLPETDEQGARMLCEKLRKSIFDLALPHENRDDNDRVTISLGMVSTVPDQQQTAATFLKKADESLYKAKKAGRNTYQTVD